MESWELHSTARRYLMDRYGELAASYASLPNQGRASDGYHYTAAAERIYPRYNLVEAMLDEVERLDPDHLPDLESLAATLVGAAEIARSQFTDPPMGQAQAEVIDAERQRFGSAVRTWMSNADLTAEPLGYRRVLRQQESSDWRRRLELHWGVEALSWYPMLAGPVPVPVLVLREEAMWDGPGVDSVREALHDMHRRRVIELREFGTEYLVDVDTVAPRYTGAEGMWTDEKLDWLVFASHEGTIAFGGAVAAVLPRFWPNLDEWRWAGW